jgi:hypothetical protein
LGGAAIRDFHARRRNGVLGRWSAARSLAGTGRDMPGDGGDGEEVEVVSVVGERLRLSVTTRNAPVSHALRVSVGRAPHPGLHIPVAYFIYGALRVCDIPAAHIHTCATGKYPQRTTYMVRYG